MKDPNGRRDAANEMTAKRVQRRRQSRMLNLFGQIDYDPKYDHKAGRGNR